MWKIERSGQKESYLFVYVLVYKWKGQATLPLYRVPWCTEALCYVGGEKTLFLTKKLWEKNYLFLSSAVQTHSMPQPI